jgi:hypothetical protein
MATLRKVFNSMPNFRILVGSLLTEPTETPLTTKLYRSSRPDFLLQDEIATFMGLDIHSILDFALLSSTRKQMDQNILINIFKFTKLLCRPADILRGLQVKYQCYDFTRVWLLARSSLCPLSRGTVLEVP